MASGQAQCSTCSPSPPPNPSGNLHTAPERILADSPVQTTWLLEDRDGLHAGLWQSTAGTWRVSYDAWEYCRLPGGHAIVTGEGGAPVRLRPRPSAARRCDRRRAGAAKADSAWAGATLPRKQARPMRQPPGRSPVRGSVHRLHGAGVNPTPAPHVGGRRWPAGGRPSSR